MQNEQQEFINQGNTCFEEGQLTKAIHYFVKAIKLDENFYAFFIERGKIFKDLEENEESIVLFQTEFSFNNIADVAKYLRAISLNVSGNPQAALAILDEIIYSYPQFPFSYFDRGDALRFCEKLEMAITDYTKAIELYPNFPLALNNRGLALSKQKKEEEAIQDFSKALELNPSLFIAFNNRGSILTFLGWSYYKQERNSEAILDCNRALQLNPKFVQAFNNRGKIQFDQGNISDSIKDFTKAIELNPNFQLPYNNRGLAFLKLERVNEALADFNKAIELKPNFLNALQNRGNAFFKLGFNQEALKNFSEILAIDPQNADAYVMKALILSRRLGKDDEAIENFNYAIEINPNLLNALYNRGLTLHNMGKWEEAISNYNKVIELNPQYYWAFLNKGRKQDAIEIISKSIELKPQIFNAYYHRGYILGEQGQTEEAIKDLTTAINLNPNFVWAYEKRALLLLNIGETELANKNFSKVEFKPQPKTDTKSVQINSEIFETFINRGDALFERKKEDDENAKNNNSNNNNFNPYKVDSLLDLTIEAYTEAIKLDNSQCTCFFKRGVQYNKQIGLVFFYVGKYTEAVSDFSKAIILNPENKDFYYHRGLSLRKLSQIEEALSDYTKAIELGMISEAIYFQRGKQNITIGFMMQLQTFPKPSRLILVLQIIIYEVYCNVKLGEQYVQIDNFQCAKQDFLKAMQLQHQNPLFLSKLGIISILQNQKELAKQYFKSVNEIMSDLTAQQIGLFYNLRTNLNLIKQQMQILKSIDDFLEKQLKDIISKSSKYHQVQDLKLQFLSFSKNATISILKLSCNHPFQQIIPNIFNQLKIEVQQHVKVSNFTYNQNYFQMQEQKHQNINQLEEPLIGEQMTHQNKANYIKCQIW